MLEVSGASARTDPVYDPDQDARTNKARREHRSRGILPRHRRTRRNASPAGLMSRDVRQRTEWRKFFR